MHVPQGLQECVVDVANGSCAHLLATASGCYLGSVHEVLVGFRAVGSTSNVLVARRASFEVRLGCLTCWRRFLLIRFPAVGT